MAIGPFPTAQQTELARSGDGLGPAGYLKLAIDGLNLASDGVHRDVKFVADLPGRELRGQQPQDCELAGGEGRGRFDPLVGR